MTVWPQYPGYHVRVLRDEPRGPRFHKVPKEAVMFTLRLDDDVHARRAAMAYADSVEHEKTVLASRLRRACRDHGGCQR